MPLREGRAGNVATEDLLFMLDGMGVRTGVDLDAVVRAGEALGRGTRSKVAQAKRTA
jgi:hydroxymethylglutaryl-CoA lyase